MAEKIGRNPAYYDVPNYGKIAMDNSHRDKEIRLTCLASLLSDRAKIKDEESFIQSYIKCNNLSYIKDGDQCNNLNIVHFHFKLIFLTCFRTIPRLIRIQKNLRIRTDA